MVDIYVAMMFVCVGGQELFEANIVNRVAVECSGGSHGCGYEACWMGAPN
jgi:hypothetical protein